jgi:hypothetical protein
MKYIIAFVFLFSGCASFTPNNLTSDIYKEANKVCLDGEGHGRLGVKSSSYVFRYYSELDIKYGKWSLGLDFPLQEEELFEIDWSENNKMKFTTSIDDKILKENSEINPKELNRFTKYIGYFLKDLVRLKTNSKKKLKFKWKTTKKKLIGSSKSRKAMISFENLDASGYFGLMTIEYRGKLKQNYKIEFVVSKCFIKKDA